MPKKTILKQVKTKVNFFQDIVTYGKLAIRLMKDQRISWYIKAIPVIAVIYFISPIDLLPMVPLDDVAVLGLAIYIFFELCPRDIIDEYLQTMDPNIATTVSGQWKDVPPGQSVNSEPPLQEIIVDSPSKET